MKLKLSVLAALCGAVAMAGYRNPVLPIDFSDPDVCVGGDGRFYMTSSSFGAVPGLPVLVSDDMVNWEYVSHALYKHPFATTSPEHGNCVWAPSIRYRADRGEYVIYWGDPDRGVYRVSAPNPCGPWSEPRLVVSGKGIIDTCPLYDDDGRVYLVNAWANSRAGFNSVLTVRELDADETKAISTPVMVYDGLADGNYTAEGPKFYKRGGEYWLMFPAGGVPEGWQVAARSQSPYGPYRAKTVMAQGASSINGPHQGGWVRSSDGHDWFLHFSDRDVFGRVVCLEPMEWREDGWPVIGRDEDGDGCGEPVEEWPEGGAQDGTQKGLPCDDEFNGMKPGPQWQWLGKADDFAGMCTPYGFYRQYSTPYGFTQKKSSFSTSKVIRGNTWNCAGLMVQKFPLSDFTATMKARVGAKDAAAESGLVVQGLDYARLGLRSTDEKTFEVVYTECFGADHGNHEESVVIASAPAEIVDMGQRFALAKDVWLRLEVRHTLNPSEKMRASAFCTFSYSFNGKDWTPVNAKKPFSAREGKWIGATFGIFSLSSRDSKSRGWIDVDWFRVR